MHLSSAMFQSVLDMLRNEKPNYVSWKEYYNYASVGTWLYPEPVGEGDDLRCPEVAGIDRNQTERNGLKKRAPLQHFRNVGTTTPGFLPMLW